MSIKERKSILFNGLSLTMMRQSGFGLTYFEIMSFNGAPGFRYSSYMSSDSNGKLNNSFTIALLWVFYYHKRLGEDIEMFDRRLLSVNAESGDGESNRLKPGWHLTWLGRKLFGWVL